MVLDTRLDLACARTKVVAEPAHDQRDRVERGQRRLHLVEGDGKVGGAEPRMGILGLGRGVDKGLRHRLRGIDELARAGDQHGAADQAREIVDGPEYLEGKLRDAVSVGCERQSFKDDVGDTAKGRCIACAVARLDETVGELRLAARVHAVDDVGEIHLLAVDPYAAKSRDLAFRDGDREVGEVAVIDGRRRSAAAESLTRAAGRAAHHLFLEVGRPDDLATETHAAVDARNGRPLGRRGDVQVAEARTLVCSAAAGGTEQCLVDETAGERTDLAADGGARQRGAEKGDAGRQQAGADDGTDGGESERGHGEPGK